jgi:putative pyoverdin transport system ATP-binding/permease protein
MADLTNISLYLHALGGLFILIGLLYITLAIIQFKRKKREFEFSKSKLINFFAGLLVLSPVLASFYVLPIAFYSENFWSSMTANSLEVKNSIWFLLVTIIGFYLMIKSTIFFQHKNKYYNLVPTLLLLSLFPGLANSLIVLIITNFINNDINAKYLLFFFCVCTYAYVVTIRLSKRKAAYLGVLVAQDLNLMILKKIFNFSYMKFEKIKSSKVYTILNDDINIIINFSRDAVRIYTAIVMAISVMIYLFTLNIRSSILLLIITVLILGFHFLLSVEYKKAIQKTRDERENYMGLIMGLAYGFKELVLHSIVRKEYRSDLKTGAGDYYNADLKTTYININKILFSDLSFIIAIGTTCLLFPLLFDFEKDLITAYVIATLFLWSPFNSIINAVPQYSQVQVSWDRIQEFLKSGITSSLLLKKTNHEEFNINKVESLEVKNVKFKYPQINPDEATYGIGPINFEAKKGEIIYIIGGNGSGKTTFLKILIGLYETNEGQILINEEQVSAEILGEHFSVIYSDFYLFKNIYGIKNERLVQVKSWLKILGLSEKVDIVDGQFTTLDLSKGQRKRLAIIKSYLEDRSIYFFDECAADLDPDFKEFFYTELLPKMQKEGKILIIITHDEKYFDLADKTYKMTMGKMLELDSTVTTLT